MGRLVLAVNPGSSSLKAALFDEDASKVVKAWSQPVPDAANFEEALRTVLHESFAFGEVAGVGCRVVDGGPDLFESAEVTDDLLAQLKSAADLAPLHSQESIDTIEAVKKLAPHLPISVAFDTTFHRTIPEVAATYALPAEIRNSYKIVRNGFHGLAYQSVVRTFREKSSLPMRLVACQLGSGSSACAILDGKSLDTTMGFTPLEGLVMGTRSGSIDPGIVLFLLHKGHDVDSLSEMLNKKSGLLGLSESSSDVKTLEAAVADGDTKAKLALDVFAYAAAKQIASMAVALGGIDAISFSGGIGEHSSHIRSAIIERLRFLGLDPNREAVQRGLSNLAQPGSKGIWVVPVSEEREIALETVRILSL